MGVKRVLNRVCVVYVKKKFEISFSALVMRAYSAKYYITSIFYCGDREK
jgi:hypothetical protein